MKKINLKKALASVAALSVVACMAAIPASANSANTSATVSSFGTTTKGAGVAFEQVTVTLDDLAEASYQVPVLVRVAPNPGVTAMEFGARIDTKTKNGVDGVTYTVVNAAKAAKTYVKLATAGQQEYTDLDATITFKTSSTEAALTWFTYANAESVPENENYALIVVTVPKDVKAGDQIDVKYSATGAGDNARTNLFQVKANGKTTDYMGDGNFEGLDGWIKIEGAAETTTTEATTTEATTTQATTTQATTTQATTTQATTTEATTTKATTTTEATTTQATTTEATTTQATTTQATTTKATTAATTTTAAGTTAAASSTGSPKTGASDVLPIAGAAAAVAVLGGVALVAKKKNN